MSQVPLGPMLDMVLRIGQLYISFRSAESRATAARALEPFSLAGGGVSRFTAQDMLTHEAARWLSVPRDDCWLVAHPPDDTLAHWVIETVQRCGAASVHRYGGSTMTDVAELPAEARTPPGQERGRGAVVPIRMVDIAAPAPPRPAVQRTRCSRDPTALCAGGQRRCGGSGASGAGP